MKKGEKGTKLLKIQNGGFKIFFRQLLCIRKNSAHFVPPTHHRPPYPLARHSTPYPRPLPLARHPPSTTEEALHHVGQQSERGESLFSPAGCLLLSIPFRLWSCLLLSFSSYVAMVALSNTPVQNTPGYPLMTLSSRPDARWWLHESLVCAATRPSVRVGVTRAEIRSILVIWFCYKSERERRWNNSFSLIIFASNKSPIKRPSPCPGLDESSRQKLGQRAAQQLASSAACLATTATKSPLLLLCVVGVACGIHRNP